MCQLRLMGITRIDGEPGVHSDFGGVKPRQLLEILATQHGQPLCKDALADALWEGRPPTSYTATLESHVSVVRRHLKANGVPRTALRTVHNGYVLTDEVRVDLTEIRQMLAEALARPPEEAYTAVEAAAPWRVRDLLASSPYSSHATRVREEMRSLLSATLRNAAEGALLAGATGRALLLARRAQAEDPASDATEQVVLRALLALDARSDALRDYADFRLRLREELGVEPSGTTQRIYLDLLALSVSGERTRQRLERSLLMRLLGQLPEERDASRAETGSPRLGAVSVA